ncbi:hypothetical protein XI05_06905 [Bradyrhizobium sp. CCBAU 11357]|nr:hypothetical protein [Bradyrhizobium sp. CCBAU 11357]
MSLSARLPEARSADAAIQLLIWAIEEIKRTGDQEILFHTRAALEQQRIYSTCPSLQRDAGSAAP